MYVRFRESRQRLQVSLAETRRIDGKVCHEHVASLGSVFMPPTVEERLAFWKRLHERLGKLSNRIDVSAQGKILSAVHARIPMVILDEQQSLKLENAEADERFWQSIHDMHQDTVEEHKQLAAVVQKTIAVGESRTHPPRRLIFPPLHPPRLPSCR